MDTKTQVSKDEVLVSRDGADRHADLQPPRGAQRHDLGHVPAALRSLRGGRYRRLHPRPGAQGRRRQGLRCWNGHQPVHQVPGRRGRHPVREGRRQALRAHRAREEAGDRPDRRRRGRRRPRHHRRRRHPHRHARGALRHADRPHAGQHPVDEELRDVRRPLRRLAPEGDRVHRAPDRRRRGARRRLRARDRSAPTRSRRA